MEFFPKTVKLASADLASFLDLPFGAEFELGLSQMDCCHYYSYEGVREAGIGIKSAKIDAVRMIKYLNNGLFKNSESI